MSKGWMGYAAKRQVIPGLVGHRKELGSSKPLQTLNVNASVLGRCCLQYR